MLPSASQFSAKIASLVKDTQQIAALPIATAVKPSKHPAKPTLDKTPSTPNRHTTQPAETGTPHCQSKYRYVNIGDATTPL
jgi:hypothetical protein